MESSMGTRGKGLPLAAASAMLFFLFCGNAAAQGTLRDEGSGVALRTPPDESMKVRFFSASEGTRPELPYSVADESRGRWLTLFEAPFRSVVAADLPESGEEEE